MKSKEKLGIKDKYNRFVDRGKDLGNKAIKVEEAMVDVVTGGGYSTAQKADQWAKDTQETINKVFNGKLDKITTEDVKEVAKKYTVDYLKGKMPKTGNDNIDASLWKEYWVPAIDWSSGTRKVTFSPGEVLANPDLKWETTISRNLGFDFSFWNGKLRGSIDAYWNSTKDILMRVPVAESTGHSYQYQNVGETSNKGLELAIFYEIIRSKDFNLSVNATYNYNKNNVEKVLEGVNADTNTNWGSSMKRPYNDYIIREGEPVGTIYGYKSNGF